MTEKVTMPNKLPATFVEYPARGLSRFNNSPSFEVSAANVAVTRKKIPTITVRALANWKGLNDEFPA
jgi:hypothetical protein